MQGANRELDKCHQNMDIETYLFQLEIGARLEVVCIGKW